MVVLFFLLSLGAVVFSCTGCNPGNVWIEFAFGEKCAIEY